MANGWYDEILSSGRTALFAGVHDALSARIAESVGFDGIWISGYGIAAARAATPDIGLTTLSEMVDVAGAITTAVNIPVVADGEVGYGNALNAMRTVRELERVGVVGMQMGDESSETCPYLGLPTKLLEEGEVCLKIEAALSARRSDDFVLFAAPQQAEERAVPYVHAGAGGVLYPWERLVDGSADAGVAERLNEVIALGAVPVAVTAPFLPPVDVDQLSSYGFRIVVFAVEALYAAVNAERDILAEIVEKRSTFGVGEKCVTQDDFQVLVRGEEAAQVARRYLPAAYAEHRNRADLVRHS